MYGCRVIQKAVENMEPDKQAKSMQGYNNEFWRNVPRGASTPYGPASVAQRDCPSVDSTASSGYGSILTPIRRSPAHSFSLEQEYLNSPAFDSWMRDDVSTGPNHMHSFSSSFQNDQLADVCFNDWLPNGIKNSCKLERQVSIPQDKAVCSSVPQVDPEEEQRREMEQMRALLSEPKPIPPAHYVCHICYEQGHYIQFCPRVYNLSTHTYGCRVIQRVLEHCTEEQKRPILYELHKHTKMLVTDQYGNYVVQHVLEHGNPQDKGRIVTDIKGDVRRFAPHKVASNVIEKCLICGTAKQKPGLIEQTQQQKSRRIIPKGLLNGGAGEDGLGGAAELSLVRRVIACICRLFRHTPPAAHNPPPAQQHIIQQQQVNIYCPQQEVNVNVYAPVHNVLSQPPP